jgi:hypothetical protein
VLYFDGLLGLLMLALWVFCIFDVITTDESLCRNLPKMVWLLIVLVIPDIGSILWLIAGRPQRGVQPGGLPYKGNTGRFPEYERPGRFAATDMDDDEEFLRRCRERAEEQRRAARERQRQKEERDEP